MMPMSELRDLGMRLQQSIVLTNMRISKLPASAAKSRAVRTLFIANETFHHVSDAVMSLQRLNDFTVRVFGNSVAGMMLKHADPKAARLAAGVGMEFVTQQVKGVIDELAALNAALDREELKNGESTEKRAA